MTITSQQIAFFETFGYLHLPDLLKTEIEWITEEFTAIHAQAQGVQHDGSQRTCIVPFIDQSERLSALLDHPDIINLAASLLDDNFNYLGGDGNYYVGDTSWHTDGWHDELKYLKIALYLDPVKRDTGSLRVIPGSHLINSAWTPLIHRVTQSQQAFGISGKDVPAIPLESSPGDVVAFNHNLLHASFGGNSSRRMFTLNMCRHANTESEKKDLRDFIVAQGRFWIEHIHSDIMRRTASAERMRHLEQVMYYEPDLAVASREARSKMTEPARG